MLFLTQPTRFSTAPFCWPRPRPTQLRGEAVVERRLPEHRVPDDQLALAREDHGFGIVPDRHEGQAPEGLQGMKQPADQRLALVEDERDVDEAAPLEAAGKEADALHDAGDVPHAHHAEVVLAEFAGDALKADERGDGHGAEPSDELVQRALAAPVAVVLAQASDDLAAGHGPVFLQPPLDRRGPGRGQRRAAHAAGADQRRGVAVPHDGFVLDPPDASHRHALSSRRSPSGPFRLRAGSGSHAGSWLRSLLPLPGEAFGGRFARVERDLRACLDRPEFPERERSEFLEPARVPASERTSPGRDTSSWRSSGWEQPTE